MNTSSVSTKRRLLWNVAILYAVQGGKYLLPLVTLPYLARVLKPDGWGAVAFAQTMGAMLAILVEYGFDFSATRETARFSTNKAALRELVAGVLASKLFLGLVGVAAAVALRPYTMRVAPSPALFWASIVWGGAQGINMLWYFQGQQRMGWAGGLDISSRTIATLSIFCFVHGPADGWKVLAAQAAGAIVSHAITIGTAYREVGFCWPSVALMTKALRLGRSMFFFKAAQYLSTADALILGVFSSSIAVGLFTGADKFRQACVQGLWPLNQALFPHQSQMVKANRRKALGVVRRSLLMLGVLSSLCGLVLVIAAPLLVRIALGGEYAAAIPILRVFGIFLPMQALWNVISFQWMLPLGFDKQFNFVVLTTGMGMVALGILLAPRMGGFGMAVAIGIAQTYALAAVHFALKKEGLSPFSGVREAEVEAVAA